MTRRDVPLALALYVLVLAVVLLAAFIGNGFHIGPV